MGDRADTVRKTKHLETWIPDYRRGINQETSYGTNPEIKMIFE